MPSLKETICRIRESYQTRSNYNTGGSTAANGIDPNMDAGKRSCVTEIAYGSIRLGNCYLVPGMRAPPRVLFPLCWQVHSIQSPGCHSDFWPVTSRNGRLWWGGPPGPHGSPWTVLLLNGQALAAPAEAGRGAGSGRGRPPYHLSHRLCNPAPPEAELTSDFLDSHIPQGYQGRSPWLFRQSDPYLRDKMKMPRRCVRTARHSATCS